MSDRPRDDARSLVGRLYDRDREALAESRFASLDAHLDEDAESGCGAEIDLRVAELDAGAVSTIRLA